jgi:membrane protein
VLLGAQIAFLVQNPRYLTISPVRLELSNRLKERLALTIMYRVGYNYYHQRPPWTLEALVDDLELPGGPVFHLLELLRQQGLLEQTADDPPAYLPARAIETIEINGLLALVRRAEETRFLRDEGLLAVEPVDSVFGRAKEAVERALSGASLRDLVLAGPARGSSGEESP